ncbi:zinc finger CCCH domain-containing protein 48-like [Gastrolobium bilobum]|uniref:zinc finger CCCH domain-containing protein 48-like n=1 Tax=Gastrolobium bilobum TaxID=150636 RepID=UPI002AB0E8BE|nr:zinc finger CCCH domain-containing protein 48-like [Gastrolobium bilobum]
MNQERVRIPESQRLSEESLDDDDDDISEIAIGSSAPPDAQIDLSPCQQDGVISAWRGSSESKTPFELIASLRGHTEVVVCLSVGRNMLYSRAMDHSIKVWDLDTLQCERTFNGHTEVVTSLICWEQYLLSSSFDCTIKVWGFTKEGTLEVTYTHTEENGVLALCGMTDAKAKPILFSERGRLFLQKDVRSLQIGLDRVVLVFTRDETGLLTVWKWFEEPKVP